MKPKFWTSLSLLVVISIVLLTACGAPTTPAQQPTAAPASAGKTKVRWFIGLGTGGDPQQLPIEEEIVKEFNAKHPNIELVMEVVAYDAAYDALATQVASGNPPDIVGPVGVSGAEAFHGQWLDLAPYIQKTKFDMSGFDQSTINFFKSDEGQVGIPFAIYPSSIYFQRDMFDEAGLKYPPQKYSEKYKWPDGKEEEWNFDTLAKVAAKLTLDKNGKDATDPKFDKTKISQYGFIYQWQGDVRALGSYWGADTLVDKDGKTAKIPDNWAKSWKWYHDSMWKSSFHPTDPIVQSEEFGATNVWNSGKVAMALTYLWYTCCIENAGKNWDMAVVPSYSGKVTANLNADTYRIMKGSKNQDAAFTVLSYFLGPASLKLLKAYGGMPARKADQDAFFKEKDEQFPWKVNWQVAKDGVQYADIPSFEGYFPNYQEAFNRCKAFFNLMGTDGNLDMDKETAKFKSDLQAIYDKAKK